MSKSVFDLVPGLEKAVEAGTKQNVRITENRCEPGDVNKYSGDYENMCGEIRIALFRQGSPVGKTTADKLLKQVRNYFHNNSP